MSVRTKECARSDQRERKKKNGAKFNRGRLCMCKREEGVLFRFFFFKRLDKIRVTDCILQSLFISLLDILLPSNPRENELPSPVESQRPGFLSL